MKKILLSIFVSLIFISEVFAVPNYKQEIDISDDTEGLRGINFKPDGTIMYITRRINIGSLEGDASRVGFINQYSLSTPFDISTATLISTTQLTEPGETNSTFAFLPHAIEFKPDGTRLFAIKNTGTLVYQYDLSTAWDVSTISFDTKFDVSDESQLRSIDFKPDGSRMYVTGQQNKKIKEYSLSTTWDVTTSNVTHVRDSAALTSTDNNPRNIQFSENGTELYYAGNGNNDMHKFTLSEAWNVSTLSSTATTFDLGTRVTAMRGFIFTSSFSRLYVTSDNGTANANKIFEYTLSCATTISCEDASQDQNVVALIESQVELSKRVIQHNTLPIMRRIKWLRRHKNYDDLNNLQAEISFSNQRLAKLVETIKPNIKREKRVNDDEWFKWNEGRIGIGTTNAKSGSLSRNIHTSGFVVGADRRRGDDIMHGYAFQFGTENIDIIPSRSGIFAKTYSLSMYGTKLIESHFFTNAILGISHIDLDTKREEKNNILEGSRNGNQIYGTINLGKRINTDNYNFSPNIKFDLGYTRLDEYEEENKFGTTTDVLLFKKHEIVTGLGTVGFLLDKSIRHYEDRIINHTGRFEYIIDFSPTSDADFYYLNDPNTMFSINIDEEAYENFRIGYGFDVTYETGWSIIANFERFHAISSGYINEIYLSVGYVPTEDIKYALALENEKASLNYNKHINGFDIQLGSNYKLLSQIPEYGATVEVVSRF